MLGQSFGGLCATTYLSLAPEGLREAFITGGVPPLGRRVDDVYRATYARTLERNRRYYERYPGDRARVRDLHQRLEAEDVRLPSGDRLTSRRLRQLGGVLGMSGGAEELHYILERPADSPGFLHDVDAALPFARDPLYAILHEACWADGGATGWSAERLLPSDYDDAPEWPRLYDPERLRENEVPVAAAIYAEDMYVERALSEETAAQVRGVLPWLTNEYQHNALRADGGRVLGRLIDMLRGRVG